MRIPLSEINNYLNTDEMHDLIQEQLSIGDMVEHDIIGGKHTVSITAHHDMDFAIKWSVFKNYKVVHDEVAIQDLETTIKTIDKEA